MRPNIATEVDVTFWIINGISILLLVIITAAMLYFLYKYNRKRSPVAGDIEGNTTIEVIWTVVPIILVLYMFYISWGGFVNMRDVPKDAMVVKVTGQMWKWTFEYDNKKKSDTLNLPHNKNVKFELYSNDVLHSFYLPQFRVKEDVVPGAPNYLWIRTDDLGTYYAACAEYCGLSHSNMYAVINVIPEDEYEIWKNILPPVAVKDSMNVDKISISPSDTTKLNSDSVKTELKTDTAIQKKPASVTDDTVKTDSAK